VGVGDEAEILIKIIESNNMRSRYKRTDRIQHNISIGIEETKQKKHKVDVERKKENRKTHSPINSQAFRKGEFLKSLS
jgi:hypothetical protein